MQYVVCYDIADDRRRDRLASVLLDYGPRAQESVFMANLDDELAAKMVARVAKVVDEQFERVHIFALCQACSGKTRVMGTAEVVEDRAFYVL
jgi:CRISPR-associated protein Cas2